MAPRHVVRLDLGSVPQKRLPLPQKRPS